MNAPPLLSIVVPVHDRADTITRCLDSIFAQKFTDYEVIAVDDGSTDVSLGLLCAVTDPRFQVAVHARNRGVCPSRNTGVALSRGAWVVFLDSDDEFANVDALSCMAAHAVAASGGISALWFRSRLDDGSIAPAPGHRSDVWDYHGYLRFLEATHRGQRDMIRCVRRRCFSSLRYPDSRMLEEKFHLDFARMFTSRLHDDVLRLYHQDAGNRLVDRVSRLDPVRDAAFIADRAAGLTALLEMHGRALARYAPRVHRELAIRSARQTLLAGRPATALAQALRLWWRRPLDPRRAILAVVTTLACVIPKSGRLRLRMPHLAVR